MPRWIRQTAQGSMLLVLSAATLFAQRDAGVTGVVRDTRGTPQMGVAVELLGRGGTATTLTDLQGRYQIKDVLPGVYQLRATAALSLPTLHQQLHLRSGLKPVVNLTMSSLLDEAAWLPATHRQPGETADDWKWTLRSSANRPMLRLADDDPTGLAADYEGRGVAQMQAILLGTSGVGGFGSSGQGEAIALAHRSANGRTTALFRSAVTLVREQSSSAPVSLSGTLQTDQGPLVQRRFSARVKSFPQVLTGRAGGLQEAEFASAQRSELGDFAVLEAGSETQLLRAETTKLIVRPFVQLTSRPVNGWSVRYALSSSPDLARYEDVGTDDHQAPTAIEDAHVLRVDTGRHQEVRLRRSEGRARLQVAYHHDVQQRTALSGNFLSAGGADAIGSLLPLKGLQGLSADTSNGAFRVLGPGFTSNGCSLLVAVPVGGKTTLSGGYLNGTALGTSPDVSRGALQPATLQSSISVKHSQAVLLALEGKVEKTGTRWITSYRWQPVALASVLLPYEAHEVTPYLSVHVRQSLPKSALLPAGLEATFDGSNLLGEGFQRTSVQTQDALLASALRDLRAGVAFTF